jgi:peptide/nickel transport system permease protein
LSKADRDSRHRSPGAITWHKFKQNKLALFGSFIIFFAIVVCLGGPLIRPDHSPKANQQSLPLAAKAPGFQLQFLRVTKNKQFVPPSFVSSWMNGRDDAFIEVPVYSYLINGPLVTIETYTGFEPNNGEKVTYALSDVLYAVEEVHHMVSSSWKILQKDGSTIEISEEEMKEEVIRGYLVTKTFWLGTDKFGRDMLSRLMAGTAISVSIGFIAVGISVLLGVLLGALAGYYRGWLDQIIMWFINVVWSIPTLLLVIAITLVLGKGIWQVFVAVGLTMWVEVARVVRGQVLSLREKEYVEAARVLGYGDARIIFRHLLPNVMSPVIVISAANFASAILIEAGLSFLGLGAQPPQATWGRMISEHKGYILTGEAYLAILPGLAIMFMVLAFMLIGNGLRDALDSRTVITPNT